MSSTNALKFTEAGQGKPVVLLHGFPLSRAIWQKQQHQLSASCRVITPDLRGHGESPAPAGVYEMELMAGDVVALLDSLQIKKAVIMGHSMGGYVTLALLRKAPDRFLAFGLIGSQAGADTEEGRQGRLKTAEKVAAEGSKVIADAMIPKLFAPGLPSDAAIVDTVRQLILGTSREGIIGTLKGMAARPDSTSLLSTITAPVLLVTGDQDQIIPAAKAQAMVTMIPHAMLITVPNAGHMPMLEQPDATTKAIGDFVSKLPK